MAICAMSSLYIVLLRPESFSLFFSYLNLVISVRLRRPFFARESSTLNDSSRSIKIMLSCKWPNATPKNLQFVAGF